MRTTIDLPDPLMRAAKAKAATAGESLKALFERAIAREVGRPTAGAERVIEYPIIRSQRVGADFSNDELAEILADDEAEDYAT